MRVDQPIDQPPLRGEAGRVAARVRELVDGADGSAASGVGPKTPRVSWYRPIAALLPVRLDPGRRAAWAMCAAVLVVALLTGLWVMSSRPRPLSVSAAGARPSTTGTTTLPDTLPNTVPLDAPDDVAAVPSIGASTSADVVVDVAGKVRRPGVYQLPAGSRINDAIAAAGGARRGIDLSTLNLAALLVDGQQILVGSRVGMPGGAPVIAVPSDTALGVSTAATIAPVSLNSATLEQLETLPRVGPVTAQKILDYRAANGSFTSIDQLKDISGIGDVTFAGIAPLVTL